MQDILTNWLSQKKLEAVQILLYVSCGPYLAKLCKSQVFIFIRMPYPTLLLKALKNPNRGLVSHIHADFVAPLALF